MGGIAPPVLAVSSLPPLTPEGLLLGAPRPSVPVPGPAVVRHHHSDREQRQERPQPGIVYLDGYRPRDHQGDDDDARGSRRPAHAYSNSPPSPSVNDRSTRRATTIRCTP